MPVYALISIIPYVILLFKERANMEGAIKTVVSVFLKSAKGKENLGEKDFQNLVKNQLKNILTVSIRGLPRH